MAYRYGDVDYLPDEPGELFTALATITTPTDNAVLNRLLARRAADTIGKPLHEAVMRGKLTWYVNGGYDVEAVGMGDDWLDYQIGLFSSQVEPDPIWERFLVDGVAYEINVAHPDRPVRRAD